MPTTETEDYVDSSRSVFLLERVARRDEDAVEELYRVYANGVFGFVYRRVYEQHEDAEEITLDTFLTAVTLAPTYRPTCSVLTWLCGIARVRITDFYRRQSRDKRIPRDRMTSLDSDLARIMRNKDNPIDRLVEQIDSRAMADRLLSILSEDEREALLLRYVEEFSVREIAEVMRRSEKGIEGLLTRAKARQRAYVKTNLAHRL